jgi:sucrose synthase
MSPFASLEQELQEHRSELYSLLHRFIQFDKPLLVRSDVTDVIDAFRKTDAGRGFENTALEKVLRWTQEAAIVEPLMFFALRSDVGTWRYVCFHTDDVHYREVTVAEFLAFKERLINPTQKPDDHVLTLDLRPFERGSPKLREGRSIGRGVEFLNRHLSSRLFDKRETGFERLLEFLKIHSFEGKQLMLNDRIASVANLREALREARELLESRPVSSEWGELEFELQDLGFDPGWGRTAQQILAQMETLADILEAPSPSNLETFLGRLPMIFHLAILSPHGYFGQSNVLGMPDTGGQVVYILDQVRALERRMRQTIRDQGLDIEPQIVVVTRLIPEAGATTCDQRLERIIGTENARILRVPFRTELGEVIPQWISRFQIWPYLERFAGDVETELLAELRGKPDVIIGNYSDGNLVASLLSQRLGVTQCNIAHALEKTKYLHSDLYWKDHEAEHRFSCQFTADLIAMNTADFIITSTYQEITGTKKSVGQYESYSSFSLPGLYRVESGIDVFDPKFNIVSPGADSSVFFPYTETGRRQQDLLVDRIKGMVEGDSNEESRGVLEDTSKPVLFAMSRLDRIKNIPGLVRWYGQHEGLRREANLFLVGGKLDPSQSDDGDEKHQIESLHALFDEYDLDQQVRWVELQSDKTLVGELYRYVADTRGAFVQPALFEAFGLTVVEAMSCGLPTFATQYGGPLEIIEHGVSGFHVDPNHGDRAADLMAEFLGRCREEPEHWQRISAGGIARVESHYTWELYADRLLTLSRIYGFWKYISNIKREGTRRYLEMFYSLMYRPLAEKAQNGGIGD